MMRRFHRCTVKLKLQLFKTYCMCFYDAALRLNFNVQTMKHFLSCYIKYIKMFFGYQKYHSVTEMLSEWRLPTLDTVLYNCRYSMKRQLLVACGYSNSVVHAINNILAL